MEKYDISSKPGHGIALIIHNHDWKTDVRDGSENDEIAFKHIAEMLNYTIIPTKSNLKADEMREAMKNAATKVTSSHDSFLCFITSHGTNCGLLGVDNMTVTVNELADLVGHRNCPNLTNKPIIFFIQACRGDDTPNHVVWDSIGSGSGAHQLSSQDKMQFDHQVSGIPPTADYLFAYCTTPDTRAMRTPATGSFYVKILHEMLIKYASKLGLYEILLKVHNELATNKCYVYKHGDAKDKVYRQMGQIVSTLRKKVYFK